MSSGVDRSASQSSSAHELTWFEFNNWVSKLTRKVKAYKPELVIGIAHGGVFVGNGLAAALKVPFYPVRISPRSRDAAQVKKSTMPHKVPNAVEDRRILIVDDVSRSGETMKMAVKLAKAAGASEIKTVCLLSRPTGFAADYYVERSDKFYVFPWDLAEVAIDARVLV